MAINKMYSGILGVLFICSLPSCTSESTRSSDDDPNNQPEPRSFYVGVSGLIPRNYPNSSDSDWQNLFNTLPKYGDYLGMHVGWNEGDTDEEGIPVTVNLAFNVLDEKSIQPYVAIGFEPDDLTQVQADNYIDENGQNFLTACEKIAQEYQPNIMLIGVEINRYFEKSPDGFADFVNLYPDIYKAVKSVSPSTMVGSNFQLEYVKGKAMRTGVQHEAHWNIIGQFQPTLDIVSFTVFPFFDYDHPEEIPDDYFSEISEHTTQPIMITETGWPTKPNPNVPDISASEDIQVEYFERLIELTNPLPLHTLIWAFQHDPEIGIANGLFDYIGLKNNDGSPKKVFSEWQELVDRPLDEAKSTDK